jgi:hypothetical protein
VEDIPARIRHFVRRFILSMDHLEVLMRLHDRPDAAFSLHELAQAAHVDGNTLLRCLRDLTAGGLARGVDRGGMPAVQYSARSVEDRSDADALARMYHERPVSLVKLVYEQPSSAPTFSEGFRLNTDER